MKDAQIFKYSPSVWLVPTFLLLTIWSAFLINLYGHYHGNDHGIVPRTFSGLQGVVLSPFLHADWQHLTNNSVPLFVLTMALVYFYRELSLKVLVYGVLLSGLFTWAVGRSSVHIGASGLIYVLVSFIFFKGLRTGYYRLMALSFAVVIVYGGMVWYVFPEVDPKISWEGHLGGFLAGMVFAFVFKTPDYVSEYRYDWERPDFDPELDPFMRRFDENGQFVNPPKPEEIMVDYEEELGSHFVPVQINYIYKNAEE
ncbi:rhomboid family intramembrane serine protease [Flavobacterium sp. N1719]|uniref:rhomboid family intramembrane serine protease n=1 Tax=Flavobacterium sp. N1719 TaxID=2885633 RepID=UPI00222384B3|nr:rhomboid family intramembrane serine protease [Flavobacterium sp. N1719]